MPYFYHVECDEHNNINPNKTENKVNISNKEINKYIIINK